LTAANLDLLAQTAALHGKLVEAWAAGDSPPAARLNTYRILMGKLGLLGVNVPPDPKPHNRFSMHDPGR